MSDFIAEVHREHQKIVAELEAMPLYRRLVAVRAVLSAYSSEEARRPVIASVETHIRADSTTAQFESSPTEDVLNAAEAYLRQVGKRVMSGEIWAALEAKGLRLNGARPSATLASYLSNAKTRFDNKRGDGYGLLEWSEKENSSFQSQTDAAEDQSADLTAQEPAGDAEKADRQNEADEPNQPRPDNHNSEFGGL